MQKRLKEGSGAAGVASNSAKGNTCRQALNCKSIVSLQGMQFAHEEAVDSAVKEQMLAPPIITNHTIIHTILACRSCECCSWPDLFVVRRAVMAVPDFAAQRSTESWCAAIFVEYPKHDTLQCCIGFCILDPAQNVACLSSCFVTFLCQ